MKQNMSLFQDMLGESLFEDDIVVYPTMLGSSARMCVARIMEFKEDVNNPKSWKVKVKPLKYNDYRAEKLFIYDPQTKKHIAKPLKDGPKAVTISRVDNLVKIKPDPSLLASKK